jgi:histidinol-phosphate aminotransferase
VSHALDLFRLDLREFAGYASARRAQASGRIWLNANESPLPSPVDAERALHRYPDPQPGELRMRMAELYGVRPEQLMVTRGSDEGIDLLVRGFCRAGQDAVLVAPPCFGMYAVCARIQNAPLVEVPLLEADTRWSFDLTGMQAAIAERNVRVVFLSSPANPTGQCLGREEIERLAQALESKAILVIDEAYGEFASSPGAIDLIARHSHLFVLRTLSKAYALAGARIGAVLGDAGVIAALRNLSAPYPIPAPSAALALAALSDEGVAEARRRALRIRHDRDALAQALAQLPQVRCVYASEGNFLLLRFEDAESAFQELLRAGVVVRDVRAMPGLGDALRITVGSPAENLALLAALQRRAA